MNFKTSLLALVMALSASFMVVSCGNAENTSEESTQSEAVHGEGKEYTSAYVCPMHCEGSGSDEAGNCPVCGMAYVPHADHIEDGHNH